MGANPKTLSNGALIAEVKRLADASCQLESDLLVSLGEVDARRLYLEEGCPSMFAYCRDVLHFSEATAYRRVTVSRAARRYPALVAALRQGDMHLTGLEMLASKLTPKNVNELLEAAKHKTKRELQVLLADRDPQPDAPSRVRRIPDPGLPRKEALPPQAAPALERATPPAPTPEPLGHGRYRVQFTLSSEGEAALREIRALLRHQIPSGDLCGIFEQALVLLRTQVRKQRFAETDSPRPQKRPGAQSSRSIPAATQRHVWMRDDGRCTFVSKQGRRCGARDFLQFHHQDNWAWVKRHEADRIVLRCHGHNQHAARQDFGEAWMAQFSTLAGES
jgi:hypothetical protein